MIDLRFSDLSACTHAHSGDLAVVHACKEPCHRFAAGYTAKSLSANDPHYLSLERGNHLYLNLIDPPVPLFKLESFTAFFDFMDRHAGKRPILIHCNKGESRAPSLALLYMAKRGHLPGDTYTIARQAFEERHIYKPGKGIVTFLEENWDRLGL